MELDVVVVGAGPAGAAAAFDLATGGTRVLLVDHRAFPRVKPCAGGLTIKALRALRFSVEPVIREVATDVSMALGYDPPTVFAGRGPVCALTVRAELDAYCLRKAIDAGAEFRVVRRIDAVVESRDGVTLQTSEGALASRYVVAADGANSTMRRLVAGSRVPALGFALEATVPMPSNAIPPMEFDFGVVDYGYGWLFPKGDHVNVGLYTNDARVRITRAMVTAYTERKLATRRVEQLVGHYIGLRGWDGECHTERVLFAGDAAGLVDPILGEGIHNAITSGQAAAGAILAARPDNTGASTPYRRRLAPILSDVKSAHRSSEIFYRALPFWFRVLRSAPSRWALMGGYARGMRVGRIKRWWFAIPWIPVEKTAGLERWVT